MENFNINDSINIWLNKLKFTAEVEYMSILQGKSIIKISSNQKPRLAIKDQILSIYQKSLYLCESVNYFQKNNKNKDVLNLEYIIENSTQLVLNVRNLIQPFLNDISEEFKKIDVGCIRLKSLIESLRKAAEQEVFTDIHDYLEAIHLTILEIRDLTISSLITVLIKQRLIVNDKVEITTLDDIYSIIKNSSYFIQYFIENETIKKILDLLKSNVIYEVQLYCVKILTYLCNSKENLQKFDKEDGFQLISFLLCNISLSEDLRYECIKLLSILFSPGNLIEHEYNGYLENLQDIITSILDLIFKTNSNEFLTCMSAILNLINYDEISLDILCEQNLVAKISDYCKNSRDLSSEIRSKILSIFEMLLNTETGLEDLSQLDIIENILFSNLKYIQILNHDEPLNSYIMLSTLKILNKIVNKSNRNIFQLNNMDGLQIFNNLIKYYPEINQNIEFKSLLHLIELEMNVNNKQD